MERAQGAPRAWEGLRLLEPLTGGNRLAAFRGDLRGTPVVVRRSTRLPAAVDWEIQLLAHLAASGARVAQPVPADDGRRHVDGWHVQVFVEGRPAADEDMPAVQEAAAAVHAITHGWPQRPGFRSARELLSDDSGGDVDLSTMPEHLVRAMRSAWMAVSPQDSRVVHGDLGPGNAIITDGGEVTLIDWDESRVDDPGFDLGSGPAWRSARLAWEVAACWQAEPAYARRVADQFYRGLGEASQDSP